MAKHSHWSQIKYKKAQTDLKKSKIMDKLIRAITVAAREGADPELNPKLRSAIERAKEFQVPLENIERAIKKGEIKESNLEEVIYEAYFDEIQLLIKAITDNKNRTLGEIKHTLNQYEARLGEPGSVIWNFQEKGVVVLSKENEERILEFVDLYEDLKESNGDILLITRGEKFNQLKDSLKEKGIEIKDSYFELRPLNTLEIDETKKEKLDQLIEDLLDLDDVEEVFTNVVS